MVSMKISSKFSLIARKIKFFFDVFQNLFKLAFDTEVPSSEDEKYKKSIFK